MSKFKEKAAYLKGLAEGLDIKADTPEKKLLLAILDALQDMSSGVSVMEERLSDLEDDFEELDEDLADLEEYVFGDEDDDDLDFSDDDDECCEDCDDDCECCEHSGAGFNEEDFIEYSCPHCGDIIYYSPEDFDMSQSHPCPNCGKELFPEHDDK